MPPRVPNDPELTKQIVQFDPLVRREVGRVMRRVAANVLFDDLYSAGRVGLWKALLKIRANPKQAAWPLQAHTLYLGVCIRGAILDELRAEDWLSRRGRQRTPDARFIDLDNSPVLAIMSHEERVNAALAIHAGLGKLDPRDAFVLTSVYLRGMAHTELAAKMRVSAPRVSQLQARALERLRAILDDGPDVGGPPSAAGQNC